MASNPIGTRCKTQHRINASVVLALVADMLKAIADYSKNGRAEGMAKGVFYIAGSVPQQEPQKAHAAN